MFRENDRIGPYILIRKIGRGAFGVVWLAERRTAIAVTRVALKIVVKEDVDIEAIKHEAAVWTEVSGHPNILPIIEADIYNDDVVIASEYASGGSLQDWLNQHNGKAPSIEKTVKIIEGILNGLEHLHSRKIIHRDLKPANILLQGETPRLADFGIARIMKTTTQSMNVSGTYAYMPPEAFDGKRSPQADIWSMGVILYQLLSGNLPFPQRENSALVGAILGKEPDPLPESIPIALCEVVSCALKKNPAERFQSAVEMRDALIKSLRANVLETKSDFVPLPTVESEETIQQPIKRTIEPPPVQTKHDVMNSATLVAPSPILPSSEKAIAEKNTSRNKLWLGAAVGSLVLILGLCVGSAFLVNKFVQSKPSMPTGKDYSEKLSPSVNLDMVRIPRGSFDMGAESRICVTCATPVHRVNFGYDFYMGKYEITQAQWKSVMGDIPNKAIMQNQERPRYDNVRWLLGDNYPVAVTWREADAFCRKLSELTGKKFRLPSEAEWEYACRAGTNGNGAEELDSFGWYEKNSGNKLHPVGQKQPNAFGLYDMHGNLDEWCEDYEHSDYKGAPTDGSSWLEGSDKTGRISRGGNFFRGFVTSSDRQYFYETVEFVGFRVVYVPQ